MVFILVTLLSLTWLGIVGEVGKAGEGVYIWTHKKFDIGYNNDRIVDVNLTSEAKVKLEPNAKIIFTYEVRFENYVGFQLSFGSYLHFSIRCF